MEGGAGRAHKTVGGGGGGKGGEVKLYPYIKKGGGEKRFYHSEEVWGWGVGVGGGGRLISFRPVNIPFYRPYSGPFLSLSTDSSPFDSSQFSMNYLRTGHLLRGGGGGGGGGLQNGTGGGGGDV